jgi:proline- and glutamine-rich splicing factor
MGTSLKDLRNFFSLINHIFFHILFSNLKTFKVRLKTILGGSRGGFHPNRGGGGAGERGGGNMQGRFEQGPGGRGGFDRILERLAGMQGPTTDLQPLDVSGVKFSGRSRLYIGNLPNEMTEETLKEMMSPFGEVGEIFLNTEKKFAFLRMGTRYEAEKAKREIDGQLKNGHAIKVRFAPHQAAVKVQNLSPWVSNELLHKAFSIFGDIERAMVFVDERGRSKGDGIVEFARKPAAIEAVKRCNEGCFFLTASIRPIIAELDECTEDEDGLQEKAMMKRNQDYQFEREVGLAGIFQLCI